jgi:transposase
MSMKQKHFTQDFRREAVRLSYESGLSLADVAQDLGVAKSTLSTWRRQYRDMEGAARISDPNEDELTRLRSEVKILRQERDILKKATAFFAREGNQ